MSRILITGAGAGLGAAINTALTRWMGNREGSGGSLHTLFVLDRKFGHDVRDPWGTYGAPPAKLDAVINCAGINKTGWLADMEVDTWEEVMDINAKGIFQMVRWALPELAATRGTVLNIISNASHMPMTCSAAYNASKGAAHILTLQMARELTKKYGITVFGISPNKLAGTEMSKDIEAQVVRDRDWTPEFAAAYQRNALLTGEETDPRVLAEFIAYLLSSKERHKFLSGCVIPYGA